MTKQTLKVILLEALDAAEIALEKDVKRDEQSKMYVQYLLYFFKSVGIDTVEKLALQGGEYIKGQVQLGIELSVAKVSLAVSTLLNLIVGIVDCQCWVGFWSYCAILILGRIIREQCLRLCSFRGIMDRVDA